MDLKPEHREKLKQVVLFLIKKKQEQSGGHCGWHPSDFLGTMEQLAEELVAEGTVAKRKTLHSNRYFINNQKPHTSK